MTFSIAAPDYDLALTLSSGQTFQWTLSRASWEGVIGGRWARLTQENHQIWAETADDSMDPAWLRRYLQADVDLAVILATFPQDPPMRASVRACRGLRLLRQDPWECLASFILSSCKQIVQIQQIVAQLCLRYGEPVPTSADAQARRAFPSADRLAQCNESDLRACKMGWRASALLQVARRVSNGDVDLDAMRTLALEEARERLMSLPGVGVKIANCVLLFALGFDQAFPVDVWIAKAIRQLYFPRRQPSPDRLRRFVSTHFGPYAGYAQQYLFHYMRVHRGSAQPAVPVLSP